MNYSVYRFTLDMHSAQSQISIPAMLGDTSRILRIKLTDGGNPYLIADGCIAKIAIKRPTGTHLEEFCTIENNTVIVYNFEQNPNTAAVEGIHECDITVYGADGGRITAPRFSMVVSEKVVNSDDINISDENMDMIDAIEKAEASRQIAETGRVNAETERIANEQKRETSVAEAVEAARQATALANKCTTFIPSVSDDGELSWENDKGLPNPPNVNIQGKDGKDAYDYAVEAGCNISEKEFGYKLKINVEYTSEQLMQDLMEGEVVPERAAMDMNRNMIHETYATKTSLAELSNSVEDMEKDIEDVYGVAVTPNYVITEAEAVIDRVISAQGNRTLTIAAITDLHYESNGYSSNVVGEYPDGIKHACQALKYIDERIKLDAVAVLGDFTDGMAYDQFATATHDFKSVNAVLDKLRFAPNLRLQGNHDFVTEHSPIAYRYIGAYNDGSVEWGNFLGGYFRKDFATQKVRVIGLNTSECGNGGVHCTDEQYNWFANSLDLSAKEDANDWQILILSHIPLDMWAEGGNYKFAYILNAYQRGTTWTSGAVSCDFSNGKNVARIIVNIHGHIHNLKADKLYLGDIANSTEQINVWRMATPNACFGLENKKDYAGYYEAKDYTKTANSSTDTAFCIYCIDLDTCTIKAICYGAGYDRELNYESGASVETYPITYHLTNVTTDNTAKTIEKNSAYFAELNATIGEIDSVTITMGGEDVTSDCWITHGLEAGFVQITKVTGPVTIVATAQEVDEDEPETPSITNVLLTSTDADGNIYNGKGWKENTRWSTSSNVEKDYTGIYLSGYIPVTWNDTIRLRNINIKDGVAENKIHYYETKGSWKFQKVPSVQAGDVGPCSNAKLDSNGNLIEFTVDATGFIRVSCSGIDETSVITINQPIE